MKKLYLLSILCLMTARIAFSMYEDKKRSWEESTHAVRQPKQIKVLDGDSDDELEMPTSHDEFKTRIETRLAKNEFYSARNDLKSWMAFSNKNLNPDILSAHIPTMWGFYSTMEAEAAKNGRRQQVEKTVLSPLAQLTRACGLDPNCYQNK